jgi:hypothetical protein
MHHFASSQKKKKNLPDLVACTAKKASYAPGVYISTWISDQHKK